MSQPTQFGVQRAADPANKISATDFAGRLDDTLDALLSLNSGSSRPPYAVQGTMWLKAVSATEIQTHIYDGSDDRLLWTINPVTGDLSLAGLTGAAVLSALLSVDGGGSGLDADLLDGLQGAAYAKLDTLQTFTQMIRVANTSSSTQMRLGFGLADRDPNIAGFNGFSSIGFLHFFDDAVRLNVQGGGNFDVMTDRMEFDGDRVLTEAFTGDLPTALDYEKIADGTVVAAASTDIALPTGYRAFELLISGMTCSVDSYQPLVRMVEDDDTLLDGATDYNYSNVFVTAGAGGNVAGAGHDSKIEINPGTAALGNASGEVFHGKFTILNPRDAAIETSIFGQAHAALTTGAYHGGAIQARRRAATAEKALRLYADSGNLSLNYALYGIKE